MQTTDAEGTFDRHAIAERSRRLLLGSETGLEVREWIIEAGSSILARTMATYRADHDARGEPIIDDALAGRLRENGLRLVPVRLEDLPAIEAELGYATLNRRGWHGQLVDWTPLHGQRAGGPQQAVFIDGRARRFDRGAYRLTVRGWILPMEDGPRLNLQIVPEYHPPQRDSLHHLLARATHDGTRQGEPITSITADLLIPPEYGLILTGEVPSVPWEEDVPDDFAGSEEPTGADDEVNEEDETSDEDEANDRELGPHVQLPPTLGQMLFELGGVRGGRGMLIFIPRVSEDSRAPSSMPADHAR